VLPGKTSALHRSPVSDVRARTTRMNDRRTLQPKDVLSFGPFSLFAAESASCRSTSEEPGAPSTGRNQSSWGGPPSIPKLDGQAPGRVGGLMAKSARKSTVKRKETPVQKAAKTAVRTTKAAAARAAKATAAAAAKAPTPSPMRAIWRQL
jgi:hypothetical protein